MSLRGRRLVWRVTEEVPEGMWVDAHLHPVDHTVHPEQHEAGAWSESSFDLQYGADVSDSLDTVPEALLDQLFPPNRNLLKAPKK